MWPLSTTVPLYGYTTFCLSTHPVEELLDCFHFEGVRNNATPNIPRQDSVWPYVFISLGRIPMSGIARSHGNL